MKPKFAIGQEIKDNPSFRDGQVTKIFSRFIDIPQEEKEFIYEVMSLNDGYKYLYYESQLEETQG